MSIEENRKIVYDKGFVINGLGETIYVDITLEVPKDIELYTRNVLNESPFFIKRYYVKKVIVIDIKNPDSGISYQRAKSRTINNSWINYELNKEITAINNRQIAVVFNRI